MIRTIFLPCLLALGLLACKPTGSSVSNNNSKNGKIKKEWLYGVWKVVAFRFEDGRVMVGEYMGYPQYEFSKDGKRTKTLLEQPAPPPEVTDYKIEGDSIKYPNSKFPAMKIAKLTQDTLVLSNDKLSWHLAK